MKRITIGILLWVLCFFVATPVFSQTPVFRNYSSTDGLPSSETYGSLHDSRGYMWFVTDRGLVKFDGYSFKTFTTNDGLPDNTLFEIFEDNHNRLWFKTFSSTIGYVDENDSIHIYPYNNLIKSYLPSAVIITMLVDNDDKLWFSKKNQDAEFKLFSIDKTGTVDTITNQAKERLTVYVNGEGKFLLSGSSVCDSIEVYSFETNKKIGIFGAVDNQSVDVFVRRLNKKDGMIICAEGEIMHLKNDTVKQIVDLRNKGRVIHFFIDDEDNLWVGYYYYGVELYTAKSGYTEVTKMLNEYSVSSILQDREKGLWFTTLENGIYYISPGRPVSYTEGVDNAKVNRVVVTDSTIIMVLSDKTILIKEKNKKGVIVIKDDGKMPIDVAYKAPDRLYFSMPEKKKIPVNLNKKIIKTYNSKYVYLGANYVWAVGQFEIVKHNTEGRKIDSFSLYSNSRPTCGFELENGNLLVGTLGGLYLQTGNKFKSLKTYNPLYERRISSITRLDDKHLVVATVGYGLFIIKDKTFGFVRQITTADGLPSMMSNVVKVDNQGTIWAGTNFGLCMINSPLDSLKTVIHAIGVYSGILSNEINDIFIDGKEIWLATSKGVSVITEDLMGVKLPDIPLHIENVTINGVAIGKSPHPPFSYKNNNVNISFTGLHFQHPGKLTYKYRLKGSDDKWYLTENRSIVYNSLPAGNYTFELKVIKPNGEENPLLATYSFIITPPFWKTWWFILLVILLVIFGIYLFIYYRLRFVKNQMSLQEDLNRFRDKALRDQMNPHFIYNSLNSIQNFMLKNNTMESVSFLSKFSRLMRLIFSNTSKELVSLESDLESLRLYGELENLRFPNRFTLHIEIDPAIEPLRCYIPPLIFQPFIENAILHGLLNKNSKGNIWLKIEKEDNSLKINITDDGIGREEAARIKERKAKYKEHEPVKSKTPEYSGITATLDRIHQVWGKKPEKSQFKIVDLHDNTNKPVGTTVQFCIPVNYD